MIIPAHFSDMVNDSGNLHYTCDLLYRNNYAEFPTYP